MSFYASSGTSAQTSSMSAVRGKMGTALLAGLGAAVAGSIIWAIVAYLTKHQFSLVAILVGALVGFTISRVRPGSAAAAAGGALLALVGCALGTFLALIFEVVGKGTRLGTVLGHLSVIVHAYPRSVGGLGLVLWLMAAAIAFANTVGLRHDRRPASPGRPVPVSAGAHGEASNAKPAPGGYGTPQAPSEDDDGRADDQAPVEWQLEPLTVQGSGAWPQGAAAALQSSQPAPPPAAPITPAAAAGAPGVYGGGPLSAPLPALSNTGPQSAPMPAFRDGGPQSPPVLAFSDAGPQSAPMPAFPQPGPMPAFPDSGPPSAPMPAFPQPGPMPAFPDSGPPSAPMPAFRDSGARPAPLPGRRRRGGPPPAPLPAFRDSGPPSAPLPAVRKSAPPADLFPDIPDSGHPSAPLPAYRDSGPPSAPLPALPSRRTPQPSAPLRARHAAGSDPGLAAPGQPAPGRTADAQAAPSLPRRQRPRGRHSRPQN